MINRWKALAAEFPRLYWYVVAARFVDALGGTLLFPFFALYITQRFGVGMTQAGVLLGISSLFGMVGSTAGGALADRFGRRRLILFGLVFSALSSLMLGLANNISLLFPLVIVVGLLSSLGNPAHEAMLADILPEAKRSEGYAILRTVFNAAWIFGTAIGGLIATRSFLALFVGDAFLSCLVAAFMFRVLPETKPGTRSESGSDHSLWETVLGYRLVFRDLSFTAFVGAGMLAMIVFQQQYGSLAVYLRDVHGIDSRGYGTVLSLTGLEVVLFQYWISRKIRPHPPFLMLAAGAMFAAIGTVMYGLMRGFWMFAAAAAIACVGEMFYFPINQAVTAGFAPVDMRGRYMAIANMSWTIPATIGPAAAGYLLDHAAPTLLWFVGGAICVVSGMAYLLMHLRLGKQPRFAASSQGAGAGN